jgi:hypothetical protein
MMCGVTTPTFGDAFIEQLSIRTIIVDEMFCCCFDEQTRLHRFLVTDMNGIHRRLGVCPQNNVLWPDLTSV